MVPQSLITAQRVERFKQGRYNPIKNLTPQRLTQQLDQFDSGIYESSALMLLEMMEGDGIIASVAHKRRMKAESFEYNIVLKPGADKEEAEAHAEVLRYCYDNLIVSDALDKDMKRSVSALFGTMNKAQGMKWQVHEILARPSTAGLTFEMIDVPLFFFEAQKGRLRFLQDSGMWEGVDMEPGAWMVTRGLGLMKPTAKCFMFGYLPKQDWLNYTEAYSHPLIWGQTNASAGTDSHDNMIAVVTAAGTQNARGVGNMEDKISSISMGNTGSLPFEPLIDSQNRTIMALWLGGDLSTMSSDKPGQVGSTNQSEDQKCIEDYDAQCITETLNMNLDKLVLEYHFGPGVQPLAYIQVKPRRSPDVTTVTGKLDFLIKNGAEVGVNYAREALNVPAPEDGEPVFEKPAPIAAPAFGGKGVADTETGNAGNATVTDELQKSTLRLFLNSLADGYKPLADRLLGIIELEKTAGEAAAKLALAKLKRDLPQILHEMNVAGRGAASVLEGAQFAAFLNGAADSLLATNSDSRRTQYLLLKNGDGEILGVDVVGDQ